ncbi:MAG: hypothetical protein DLM59_13565 [Pseudonocardiales bacterium]|nr:MAG: hypothetical protein DLM59_13565 [Pseudonocardiales bacterium]
MYRSEETACSPSRWPTPGEAKTIPYRTIDATAEAIIREGIASADEVAEALQALSDFAADPGYLCGSPRNFQAWSRRPVA